MDLDYTTNEPKMEKDYSESVNALLPEVEQLVATGQLTAALEKLHGLEKKTRSAADLASTTRLLTTIASVCGSAGEWRLLEDEVAAMAKKHGQLKQAITQMVQKAMEYVAQTPDEDTKVELIESLRTVTEGKIHVEIMEKNGKVTEACDTLQEVQVETFGSMERREKTDFILEQMRLCLAKRDYVRTAIISHKINPNCGSTKLMIQYDLHEENFLEVCRHFNQVYQTKGIKDDATKVAGSAAEYGAQSDLLHRIQTDHNLEKLELCSPELARWPAVESLYGGEFRQTDVFSASTEDGNARWKALRDRVIEHNIRVIAGYYTRITLARLTELLDLPRADVEAFLSKAVVDGSVYARIDRPAGLVSFIKPRDGEEQLNEWASDINKLLGLVEKTTHLIAKEEIVHKISRAI
ncbi:hypothetical protein DL89DRAFT_319931 [Linderina pennispora]|uniref:PCI domain-containing protein n=1 Tax=Linderina pennispora TaxID=61395 RepID=A0A1Y1WLK6_9FUNG|nr:uncharacterized protein DL89DRAFT_319931 [Linderina pennispora]ORX74382.1 hypothetical protein DL89DRAFT_319931 [Linderina pennispora]